MKRFKLFVIFGAALALAACGDDDTTADAGTGGGTGGTEAFVGGTFQLTTHAVSDKCLDGGLDLLFMPDGAGTPYDLANKTELPGTADLPSTYKIQLQAPFAAMDVTVTAGATAGAMAIKDAKQAAVAVDAAKWPNCKADMTINADITVDGADTVSVNAKISVDKWDGSDCPAADAGCLITLDMKGAR